MIFYECKQSVRSDTNYNICNNINGNSCNHECTVNRYRFTFEGRFTRRFSRFCRFYLNLFVLLLTCSFLYLARWTFMNAYQIGELSIGLLVIFVIMSVLAVSFIQKTKFANTYGILTFIVVVSTIVTFVLSVGIPKIWKELR